MPTELKVVMFADQIDSTKRMQQRTFAEVKVTALAQDSLTAEAVGLCRGKILKDTGDGHMIEFRSCSDAVRCGFIIQSRVRQRNDTLIQDQLKFDLHIGIDFGETVLMPNGDLRATTANLAARVSAQCPAGEVYFTEKVKRELDIGAAVVRRVPKVGLKGFDNPVSIYCLTDWLGEIESSPNPFIWRDGITRADDFFDRTKETKKLLELLHHKQNCQIVGPRRIGKTSLLRQVERMAVTNSDTLVAYLDLQDPRCFTLSGWLAFVGKQWNWSQIPYDLVDFAEGIEKMLTAELRPVLCLDEFEEPASRRSEFSRDFFLALRSCGQRGLSIVTTSLRPLNELTDISDPTSPFYNTFKLLELDVFTEIDAHDFISIYRPGVQSFTEDEKKAILSFAKGHPLALQVACYYILEARETGEILALAIQRAATEMKAALPLRHANFL